MTQEQFLDKWGWSPAQVHNKFAKDLEAVIANEVAKLQELPPNEGRPQPELNEIERAYEDGMKIRRKEWKTSWIKKHSKTKSIDEKGAILNNDWSFVKFPQKWELYHEPELAPAEPSSQAILDNSFDRERFERLFCAVVANGDVESTKFFECTKDLIKQLDAYYAEKEKGGANE